MNYEAKLFPEGTAAEKDPYCIKMQVVEGARHMATTLLLTYSELKYAEIWDCNENIFVEVVERPSKENIHTCPARVAQLGPWKHQENLDIWEPRGPDRVCSFCGSIHPDELLALMEKIAVKPDLRIELNDHCDKIYMTRAGIKNASEGAIKFKLYHAPVDKDDPNMRCHYFVSTLNQALAISRQRYAEDLKKFEEDFIRINKPPG